LLDHYERGFRHVVGRRFCWHAPADEIAHGFLSADLDAAHARAAITNVVGRRRSRDCASAGSAAIALDNRRLPRRGNGTLARKQARARLVLAGFEVDDGNLDAGLTFDWQGST
jgi:hypothetical protein